MKNINDNLVEYSTKEQCPSSKKMLIVKCVTRKENTVLFKPLIIGYINLSNINDIMLNKKAFLKELNNKWLSKTNRKKMPYLKRC